MAQVKFERDTNRLSQYPNLPPVLGYAFALIAAFYTHRIKMLYESLACYFVLGGDDHHRSPVLVFYRRECDCFFAIVIALLDPFKNFIGELYGLDRLGSFDNKEGENLFKEQVDVGGIDDSKGLSIAMLRILRWVKCQAAIDSFRLNKVFEIAQNVAVFIDGLCNGNGILIDLVNPMNATFTVYKSGDIGPIHKYEPPMSRY